jgi:hypothetical protein
MDEKEDKGYTENAADNGERGPAAAGDHVFSADKTKERKKKKEIKEKIERGGKKKKKKVIIINNLKVNRRFGRIPCLREAPVVGYKV